MLSTRLTRSLKGRDGGGSDDDVRRSQVHVATSRAFKLPEEKKKNTTAAADPLWTAKPVFVPDDTCTPPTFRILYTLASARCAFAARSHAHTTTKRKLKYTYPFAFSRSSAVWGHTTSWRYMRARVCVCTVYTCMQVPTRIFSTSAATIYMRVCTKRGCWHYTFFCSTD